MYARILSSMKTSPAGATDRVTISTTVPSGSPLGSSRTHLPFTTRACMSALEVAIERQPIAAAVLHRHLARAPFLILQAGPIVLVLLRGQLGVKRLELVAANAN